MSNSEEEQYSEEEEDVEEEAEDDDDGGGKPRARRGRPRGGKGPARQPIMKHKRKTKAEMRDAHIVDSAILVILPQGEYSTVYSAPTAEDPSPLEQIVKEFMEREEIHHCYDFLELHCFLDDDAFDGMQAIYGSNDMVVRGLTLDDYKAAIDETQIPTLFDTSLNVHNAWVLPHVN